MESYEEYKTRFFNSDHSYFSKQAIEKELLETKKLLVQVKEGSIKPSKIIGTGYKNPKTSAIKWLNEKDREYQIRLESNGDCSILRGNYEFSVNNYHETTQ